MALVLSAHSGGTQGPALRLCHDNAVVLRPTGPDSRGRLSLRIVPHQHHCGADPVRNPKKRCKNGGFDPKYLKFTKNS